MRITDLAEKWLSSKDTRKNVINTIFAEQFIDVLPEQATVWVKECKPSSSTKMGQLAENLRQARKEMWEADTGKMQKRCYNCKMARDSHQCKGNCTVTKGTQEESQKSKSIVYFNCKARGQISRNCPKAMLCRVKSGEVDGKFADDIQLDTGYSRTVV